MITEFFGDAKYKFHIGVDEALEWERSQRKSLYQCFRELSGGTFYTKDVKETLRLGLIGGGLDDVDAFSLVEAYFGKNKLEPDIKLAIKIIEDAYFTPPPITVSEVAEAKIKELEEAMKDFDAEEWRENLEGLVARVLQK